MREILFRGKHLDTNEWVYGLLSDVSEKLGKAQIHELPKEPRKKYDYGTYHNVKLETVGQFVGKEDREGIKIFEGDIIKTKSPFIDDNTDYIGTIVYKKEWASFGFYHKSNAFHSEAEIFTSLGDFREDEVIGNKTDNPELLK